jgi:hypothetical protein
LKEGDRITLGHPNLTPKSAAITFEYQVENTNQDDGFNWELVNCDIFCLILEANHPLNIEELWLLEKAQKAAIHKQFMIVNIPKNTSENIEQIETNIGSIKSQIQSFLPTFNPEIISLHLTNFSSETEPNKIEAKLIKQLEKFTQSLERVVKIRPEDILSKRLDFLVGQQKQKLSYLLEEEKDKIKQQVQQLELEANQSNSTDLKDRLKTILVEIKEKQNRFFKSAKDEVNQSKSDLLYKLNTEGLSAKIQGFIDNLYPIVTYQDGLCIVQLHVTEQDVHEAVMKLLQTEFNFWALEEWEKIQTFYGGGGFESLIQQSNQCLKNIPSISVKKDLLQSAQPIKVQQKFSDSVLKPSLEKQDKQPGLPGYIMHKIRHDAINVGMMLTIVGGGLFGVFSLVQENIFPNLLAFKSEQKEAVKQKSSSGNTRNILLFLTIPALLPFTYRNYKKDKANNSEKITQQLKDDLSKHYEGFLKEHTDKIAKTLLSNLEEVDYQFTKKLDKVEDKYKSYLADLEQQKQAYKTLITQYGQSLRTIDLQLREMNKL